jgi:SAM-dependent methyltransferase
VPFFYQPELNLLPIKTFLHVGCGLARKDRTTADFAGPHWRELRLDIDPGVNADIIGTMTHMTAVKTQSVDAVFSSHNIEHLYPHEVPLALREFNRVLKPEGFAVITCPDLQTVAALIAADKLTDAAYASDVGPVAPLDILYGFRPQLAAGNLFMAHHCGFTRKVLAATLVQGGFGGVVAAQRGAPWFDLWAVAGKSSMTESDLQYLARQHFPGPPQAAGAV